MGARVRLSGRTAVGSGVIAMAILLGSFAFSIAAPASPTISGPTQNSIQPASVRARGTAPAGTTVELFEGGTSLGTTTTAANGTWSKTVGLAAGNHTMTAIAGNSPTDISAPSGAVSFVVDTAKPVVSVASPTENAVLKPGDALSLSGTATDDRRVFAVKLEYWSLGRMMLRSLASCVCDGTSAEWTHAPSLTPGYYTVLAYAIDLAANQSLAASRNFLVATNGPLPVSPPVVPGAPVIQLPGQNSTVPGADKPIRIGGKAPPGSTVKLTEQSIGPIGVVRTDGRGYWSSDVWLPSGRFGVAAQAFDSRGRPTDPSKILTFYVDADRPSVGFLTQDNTVFVPLQPVRISGRIFDNRRVASVRVEYWLLNSVALREWARCVGCSTTDAAWSDSPRLPYPGTYEVVARGFDAAGNQSWSTTITIVKVA
jgi:hypothetical protein